MRFETLFDAGCRVAGIYPVDGIGDPEHPPQWVEELAEYLTDHDESQIFEAIPELRNYEDLDEALVTCAALMTLAGVFVQIEHCVVKYVSEQTVVSGWGHYQTEWVYLTKIEDVAAAALRIANAHYDKARGAWLGASS